MSVARTVAAAGALLLARAQDAPSPPPADDDKELTRRVNEIYKRGPLYTLEALLSAESFGALVARYKYLHIAAQRDRALVQRVELLRQQITSQRSLLVRLQGDVEANRREKAAEEARLRRLELQRGRTLAQIEAQQRQAQERLTQIARIPAAAVSAWVQPVDAAAPSLAVNAAQPMNPASVMKLVTTFAALETLGPAHRWTTRLVHDGAIRDGTLDGTLYLVGGADPVLGYERLWKMLRRLRALGIERIAGDIVLDGSVLRLPPHDPAEEDAAREGVV